MEKKFRDKILILMMIITVLTTNFYVLGTQLITYALQQKVTSETNNSNIEFLAYFKDGENEKFSASQSIKADGTKLYAEIKVKNEGYIKEGATIEIADSNFKLKQEVSTSNTHVNSIEGNKVNLKQINAGETVEVELGIEPVVAEKVGADFLNKETIVNMTGSYVYSKAEEGVAVYASKPVCLSYQPDETTGAELTTEIITNKVVSVNGANKRIIQALVKSRLTDNGYPISATTISASVPSLGESEPEISVMAADVLATSGKTEIDSVTKEDGKVKIVINNNADSNNEINWSKNSWDEVVVTYIYPEDVDASEVAVTANSDIKLHSSGNTYTSRYTKGIVNQEPSGVVIGKSEITTDEIYKGNLYAKAEQKYNTKTSIIVTTENVVDKIVTTEGADVLETEGSELIANAKYETTKINLGKMLELLGQDGSIEIKNGETTTTINKDTETDENGNVVIKYEDSTEELTITTSKPIKTGILELEHTKIIPGEMFERAQLKEVKTLKTQNTITGTLGETEVVKNTTKSEGLELKETTTKAELTIDKTTFSTAEENEVTVGVKLITNGSQYDLYKNAQIGIKFPSDVENVELISEPNKQNANEFTIKNVRFIPANKIFSIQLQGEQTKYPESDLMQPYVQLNLKVTLNKEAMSKADEITLIYVNENAIQYEGGESYGAEKQAVEISAPKELIKIFNIDSNTNTSRTEKILQQVKQTDVGKEFKFDVKLINNNDTDMKNIRVIGKLPTEGNTIQNETNTLITNLKNIVAENAKIYYTENSNATDDVENTANGWTEELKENAKLYLIKVEQLAIGESFDAEVSIQMPSSIKENAISFTEYEVVYDTQLNTNVKESSRVIGLSSSLVASVKVETTAQVGRDTLKNGDEVKEGEVIKYTTIVKNIGRTTLENVQLKLDVPEGTTYVKLKSIVSFDINEITPDVIGDTYEEITDAEKLNELINITIPQLSTTEPYQIEYEVRVNKGTENTNIMHQAEAICNGETIESNSINNIIKKASVRVTIRETNIEIPPQPLIPGNGAEYIVNIENLTDTTLKNLKLEIVKDGISLVDYSEVSEDPENGKFSDSNSIIINELLPNAIKAYGIKTKVYADVKISAIANDNQNEKYRSNLITEKIPNIGITIDMNSPQDKKTISEGDIVEYNINITNIGEADVDVHITDMLPQFLQISENGKINKEEDISNYFFTAVKVKKGEMVQLDIEAKVQYIPKEYNGKTVTNQAIAIINEEFKYNSQIVTHILKANGSQEVSGNIISGYAWFDKNKNGIRDAMENIMPDVNVKIYDMKNNSFVSDENGNIIQVKTDSNGEYSFSSISNGKYLVVFEYDTEKYEFTTKNAEGVDTSLNSKVDLYKVKVIEGEKYVAAIEIENLTTNMFDMNIGLKEKSTENPPEHKPGDIVKPEDPNNPDNPDNPNNPDNPDNPNNPDDTNKKKTISGYAWLDTNRNGIKDNDETNLSGIKVKIYDVNTKSYLRDENNNVIETITDNNGKYELKNITPGDYKILFEYDVEKYEPTLYMLEGADTSLISKAMANVVNIDGKEEKIAVTDTISVKGNISNINIGLKEKVTFDLELEKHISRIVVQNSKGTKAYDYNNSTLAKVEIHKKQLNNSLVVIEYSIKVKNTGDIAGYAKNVVDYLPNGLTFSSELNQDWYLLGNNLHTKKLENEEIKPGEEKEIKLILTKVMTADNVGLINNRAEIYEDYNKYGEADIDSKPNNQNIKEDDMNAADVIIAISTGGATSVYIVLFIINIILISAAIYLLIKNNIINIPRNRERR